MPKVLRELVGRAMLLVLGLALLYAGYRCCLTAWAMYNDPLTGDDASSPVVKLPALIGVILVPIGGVMALFAVTPVAVIERLRTILPDPN